MRVLRQRRHHDRQSLSGSKPEGDRRRDPPGDVRRALPLSRARAHDPRHQAVRRGGESMKPPDTLKGLTPSASAALESTGLSRRKFIQGSGALIVGFTMAGLTERLGVTAPASAAAQRLDGAGSRQLDSWIAVGADGSVTAYTGKCEFGQGLYTAQTQLVAEELGVPIDRVKLVQSVTGVTPDQGVTSGAQSHPQNFNHANLALAGATAREALLQLASTRLGAPVEQLTVSGGIVSVQGNPAKNVGYGELVGGKKFNIPLSGTAKRKHSREWVVLGTPVHRLDLPAMATAELEYVHNVRL